LVPDFDLERMVLLVKDGFAFNDGTIVHFGANTDDKSDEPKWHSRLRVLVNRCAEVGNRELLAPL
jgi:hypothetical protein